MGRILINAVVIGMLIGRADCGFANQGRRKQIGQLLNGVDKTKYLLVLDHQPRELVKNAVEGIDLHLSGHTHAGQIFPGGIISRLFGINEQNYGIRKEGSFTSIVSSGIGGWGSRIRTQGHSEYVIVEIEKE